jgi:hypothetical protein
MAIRCIEDLQAPREGGMNLVGLVDRLNRKRSSLEPPPLVAAFLWFSGWHLGGPPPMAKRRNLLSILKARDHKIFIEAGTYKGATTAWFARHADNVVSVELDDGLFEAAQRRFANTPNVAIIHGDSMTEIPKIVANCPTPPLVFLDGHYSGPGTAVGEEMEPAQSTLSGLANVAPPGSTIVIDDLRLFGSGITEFPQLDEITAAAREAFPDALIRVGLDSIVVEVSA